MNISYLFLLFLLFYLFIDYLYSRKNKDTPKYYRLLFYLGIFLSYTVAITKLNPQLFTSIYFGVPNLYWFYFISFVGIFIIAFGLDVIFISQKNIIEITTSGIKFSEKDREIIKSQHHYLEMFENLLAIENDMIQNTCEYMKIENYRLLDALLLSLNDEELPFEYEEIEILEHYLSHFFRLKDANSNMTTLVKTYYQHDLAMLISQHQLRKSEQNRIKDALHSYGPSSSGQDETEDIYNIDENNLLFKKLGDRHIVIFCYYYQHIGENILITIDSPMEILRAELYMISNILMSFERHYFTVCNKAIETYYRTHQDEDIERS